MTFPIQIQQTNGTFTASVVGSHDIRAVARTRDEVLAALRQELDRRITVGEITTMDVPAVGVTSFAGIFKDDPTLAELRDEIYRRRDAEPYP